MTFTDSTDQSPLTFASGIEDGDTDVTGPVDAAEVERILAEQYGIEVTPTLPVDTPLPDSGSESGAGESDGSRPDPSAGEEASIPSSPAPSPPSTDSSSRVDPDTGVPIESPMDQIVADAPPVDEVILVDGPTPGVDAPAEPAGPVIGPVPAPSPPPDAFSADEFYRAAFGTVDETLVRGTADMVQRYQNLPPEYRQIVDDLFSGRTPTALQPQPQYQQPAPQPQPQPAPAPQSPYDPWLDDPTVPQTQPQAPAPVQPDPATLAALEQTRREIEDLRAIEAARIQREVESAANAAVSNIRSQYPDLTEGEIAGIAYAVNQSGYVAQGLAQGQDPRAIWEQAAEQIIWTNPELRPKAIAAQAQLPVTAVPPSATPIPDRDEATEAERRARAAAVAGGSGVAQSPLTSLTPPGEQFSPPTDAAGRRGWSVDQIADALKGLQSET